MLDYRNRQTMRQTMSDNRKLFQQLKYNKAEQIFDIQKFHQCITLLKNTNVETMRLIQMQCIHCIQFVLREDYILQHPCWIVLINIVALDMFWSKYRFCATLYNNQRITNLPQKDFCNRLAAKSYLNNNSNSNHLYQHKSKKNKFDDNCK